MKKILIPTDFSANSKNAIRYAIDLFKEIPCHFFLLFINLDGFDYIQKPVYQFGTNILVQKESNTVVKKFKDLEKYIREISRENKLHHFTTVHEKGYFLESIRKQILDKEIELIIMGTKGASELKEFFMGSNTGDVITKIECDILVIPDKTSYQGLNEVVFPTDFELTYSDDVLIGISNVVTVKTANIRVLHVLKPNTPSLHKHQDHKQSLLQRLAESLPNTISFHTLEQNNVENAILSFANNVMADLIIMVSKDYNFLQKQFLDTTVEEVSFDTKIPLLAIQG